MALSAFHRDSKQALAKCFCFIDQVFNPVFLRYYSAFLSILMIAKESCSQNIFLVCIWQHVSGDLPFEKLVIGKIFIERVNHPISPGPLTPYIVILIAVTVRITCYIEPMKCHLLAVLWRLQQFINSLFIRTRIVISQRLIHFFNGRRQPGKIEIYSLQQPLFVSILVWIQSFFFDFL